MEESKIPPTHTGRRLLLDPDGDLIDALSSGMVTSSSDVVAPEDADEEEIVDLLAAVVDASEFALPDVEPPAVDANAVKARREDALKALAVWHAAVRKASTPLERQLRAQIVRGEIEEGDADAIREFCAFLSECGPNPGQPGHDPKRYAAAIRRHWKFVTGEG
jgi:hypothetical protein